MLYFVNGLISGIFVILLLRYTGQHISKRLLCLVCRNSLFIMAMHLPFGLCYVPNKAADKVMTAQSFSITYVIHMMLLLCAVLAIEAILISGEKAVRTIADRCGKNLLVNLLNYL